MQHVDALSFVVITRNRKSELANCLASIQRQQLHPKDIVVVDNGSTDGTGEYVRSAHPTVRLIEAGANLGVSRARNLGVGQAAGDICVFLDDDAEFEGASVGEVVAAYFRRQPRLGLIAFTILAGASGAEEYAAIPRADKRCGQADYACSYFAGGGFAVRKRAFLEAGMFWESIVYSCEELDLSYRLIDRGYELIRSQAVRVRHWAVPKARPPGQYLYSNARNRPLVAVRNLPWQNAMSMTAVWWSYLGWVGLRTRQVTPLLRGIWDSLRTLPSAYRSRQCVSRRTMRVVAATSGRRWW